MKFISVMGEDYYLGKKMQSWPKIPLRVAQIAFRYLGHMGILSDYMLVRASFPCISTVASDPLILVKIYGWFCLFFLK